MQRFTFQLSIGGNRIMSTKDKSIGIEDSPKGGKKTDQENVPNGDIKSVKEIVAVLETQPESKEKTDSNKDQEKIENNKNMEQKQEEKPKGITKEVEEQILNGYKHVSEAYKKSLIKFFKAADTDNVGFLTIQKFAPAVRKLGYTGTDRAIAKMFIDINSNFDGEITIHEFMNEMTKRDPRKMTETELVGVFKQFDKNKDGYITKEELEQTMDAIKMQRTDILVTDIIKRTDRDGDGKISLDEFKTSCQYKPGQVLV